MNYRGQEFSKEQLERAQRISTALLVLARIDAPDDLTAIAAGLGGSDQQSARKEVPFEANSGIHSGLRIEWQPMTFRPASSNWNACLAARSGTCELIRLQRTVQNSAMILTSSWVALCSYADSLEGSRR